MFKLETVLPVIISAILIGAVAYYFYTKITTQNNALVNLSKRCEMLEMTFMRPPGAELDSVLDDRNTKVRTCKEGICTIEPILTDDNELDQILTDELSQLRKKPKQKPKKVLAKIEEIEAISMASKSPKDKEG